MTKEELENEAETIVYGMGYDTYESEGHSDYAVQDILIKFAESREKHITDLEKKYDTYLRENTGLKIHNAYVEKKLIEGREVVLSLYNAIRDYLMITNDETFDRLNKAINDKRIEKFIEDTRKFIKEE